MVIKKIAGAGALALAVMLAAGCASTPTGSAADTAAYQQNVEAGLPAWADASVFSTAENKNGEFWKGPVVEDGWFFPGSAKFNDVKISTRSAELDAKAQIATKINAKLSQAVTNLAQASGDTSSKATQQFQNALETAEISGVRRVDRFVAKDGTVYVLMFAPGKEVEEAVRKGVDSEYSDLVTALFLTEFLPPNE